VRTNREIAKDFFLSQRTVGMLVEAPLGQAET
jgi:DNA-binding CsgD family transcriptional regulator